MQSMRNNSNNQLKNFALVFIKKIFQNKKQAISFLITSLLLLNSYFADSQTVPTPEITGNTSFCAGTNTTLSTASVSGYTYCWQNTSATTTWQNVGTAGFTAGRSFYQSLAFNGNTPYVAYQDEANGSKTSVMKFDGTNWVYVGNSAFSSGYSDFQNLSFSGNIPYVAFRDWGLNLNGKCTVMKFDGTNWVYVGTPGFTTGEAGYLKFVINAGIPYIAFQDEANNYEATVMKFDGANWVYVGNPGFSAGSVNWMSLAFNGNTPYLAFADGTNSSQKTTVMKFNGTNWVNVGNPQFTPGATRSQSLAFDGITPYVAFMEDALNFKTSVMKFDGTNWVYVGNPGISAGSSSHVSLAINNNTPYVAYQDDVNFYKTTVMKFNGASWVALGGTGISSGFANYQSLVFNGNTPYVAFADEPTNYKTTVMKYELGCVGTSNSIQINTPGTYTVTVTSSSGSATSSPVTVTGGAIPTVSCPGNLEVCSNTPVFALTGGSPAGGVYSGPGVNNNQFNPASVGTGIKNITYTYTDPSSGCSNSCGFTITIDATAPVITPLSNNIVLPLNANGTRTVTLADIATITDNCITTPAYTINPSSFNCSTLGLRNITVTATDGTFGTPLTPAAATFYCPFGLDFDAAGNMYIADQENNKIRKISTSGIVSTLAGNGNAGFADGPGTSAMFNDPRGIAIDGAGNIYTSDINNHRIRKITPAGVVTTFAGGAQGYANGTGGSAQFSSPRGLAFDAQGNLYVADAFNARIRKITPAGVVTTVAGNGNYSSVDGPVATASIYDPVDVALDAAGNIYVAEASGNKIRKISTSGFVSTIAGDGTYGYNDGAANTAKFAGPQALTVDNMGNVYVADFGNNRIRKINTSNVVSTVTISGYPSGVTIGPNGNLFMTDFSGYIKMVTTSSVVTTLAGANQTGSQDGSIGVLPAGNQTIVQIPVTITGQSIPVFSTTQSNVSVIANANCSATLANYASAAAATSSCGGAVTISQSPVAGTVLPIGTTTVTLTATDASNNTATQTFVVTVTDNAAPVITPLAANTIINLDANGTKTITAADIATVTDCNASAAVRINPSTFNCTNIGGQTVTVEATDGSFGTGPNPAAVSFINPQSVVVDAAGNKYVAANNQIRKISPSGDVTTLAGSGVEGTNDGIGLAASFYALHALAIDAAGNIYTAELFSRKVRKVTPAGVVTTYAGTGSLGSTDGPASSATFSTIYSVAVDLQGNVFVADAGNNKIRKINTSGVVSTYAGTGVSGSVDGPVSSATFAAPISVAVDASGNVYVGQQFKIRRITPGGIVSTFAGSDIAGNIPGNGTNARMARPMGMVFDAAGNLFATQEGDGRIIKVTPAADVSTFAGHYGETTINGTGTAATFRSPEGLGIDASGNLYVADWFLKNIRMITPAAVVTTFAGSGIAGSQNGNIGGITGNYTSSQIQVLVKDVTAPVITPVSNNIILNLDATGNKTITAADIANVTDNCNSSSLIRINPTAFNCSNIGTQNITVEATDGSFPTPLNPGAAAFANPYGIVFDRTGNLFIVDESNQRIRKIDISGNTTTVAGNGSYGFADGPAASAMFSFPNGIAVDAAGNIFVGDDQNNRIRKITPAGVVSTFAGNGANGSIDGTGTNAEFTGPSGVAFDNAGNLIVADTYNQKIRKITPAGVVTTIASNILLPFDVAVAPNGDIYVAQYYKVSKITPNGNVTTIAGTDFVLGYQDGPTSTALFGILRAIELDATGNIYVTDNNNRRVRKITTAGIVETIASSGYPGGIAFSPTGGLYFTDHENNKIIKLNSDGSTQVIAGAGGGYVNGNVGSAGSGNFSSVQIPVTVRDITPPSVTCPANITTPTTATHPNQTGWATATDICTPVSSIVITYTDNTQGCNINRTWKATDASGNFSTCLQTIAIPQMSVTVGPDMYILYGALGYVGCKTLTPVITGGVAPYTYLWTSTQASVNNATTSSIFVCNTTEITHTYTVTVTGATGCVATATVVLHFIDISCSTNGNNTKVSVCLRPQGNASNCHNVCVSQNAAPGLVSNGSYYGQCLPGCEVPIQARGAVTGSTLIIGGNETPKLIRSKLDLLNLINLKKDIGNKPSVFNVKVINNPTETSFRLVVKSPSMEKIMIRLFDATGRTVETNQNGSSGEVIELGKWCVSGIYFAEITQGENFKVVKLIKQ